MPVLYSVPVAAPKNLMPETLSRTSRGTRKLRRSVLFGMVAFGMANAATNVVGAVPRASEGGGGYGSAIITCDAGNTRRGGRGRTGAVGRGRWELLA